MASYEIEHNVPPPTSPNSTTNPTRPTPPPRRPDLSTFFSSLNQVDTSTTTNEHAIPLPSDVAATFRSLAEAFATMRLYRSGDGMLDGMIESLMAEAEAPPREVKGVGQGFLDELERVPKKTLKKSMDCPICGNAFLDDQYPLVVRLPCNPKHMFDLECIAPWLKLHATCPMDRKDISRKEPVKGKAGKKKEEEEEVKVEEEDGEWDDMYA